MIAERFHSIHDKRNLNGCRKEQKMEQINFLFYFRFEITLKSFYHNSRNSRTYHPPSEWERVGIHKRNGMTAYF